MGKDCFKDAVQITDCYHGLEHAGQVLAAQIGKNPPGHPARLSRWAKRLLKDQVESLTAETRQASAGTPQSQAVEEALGYFERNISRMQYGTFRKNGWFTGSGVVEAGGKTVIGARQTIGHVLVKTWGAECPGPALPPDQPKTGRVLETSPQSTRQTQ